MKRIFLIIFVVFFTLAGYAQKTYTIGQAGGITGFRVLNAIGGTSYCGTNTSFTITKSVAPEIIGYISDMGTLNTGDNITIRITSDPNSTYSAVFGGVSAIIKDLNGIDVFTISKSGTNTIILTRTANVTPSGKLNFIISMSAVWISPVCSGTYSEWWIEGFDNVACIWTNDPKKYTPSVNTTTSSVNVAVTCGRRIGISTYLYNVYNTLLADIKAGMTNQQIKADLLAKFPFLGQDYVTYIHVEANRDIISINPINQFLLMFDLMADGSGINTAFNNDYNTSAIPFTRGTLPPDLTAETAYTTLQPGQYGIVQNSDDSYTIVTNYGKLLGDTYVSYPAGYDMGDALRLVAETPEIVGLQQQILNVSRAINLAAEGYQFRWNVSFSDCSTQGTVCFTVQSNLLKYGNLIDGAAVSPRLCGTSTVTPSSNANPEQTQITVHYVNTKGLALANTTVSYGYPQDNTAGQPATIFHSTSAPLTGLTAVSDPAVLANVAGILGIPPSQALPGTGSDLYYPSPTVNSGIQHVYYVYEPWTALVNPHIRRGVGN